MQATLPVELARRVAAGDPAAFEAVVEAQWTRLVALARSVLGDRDAEDAVQDGLVVAWQRLATLRVPAALGSWLATIVLRTCFARARRRWRWLPLDVAPPLEVHTDPGSRIDVGRLLSALAPRQRAVLHLTVVEGLSDSEIGRLLAIRPASVRAHRRRAREHLDRLTRPATPPTAALGAAVGSDRSTP